MSCIDEVRPTVGAAMRPRNRLDTDGAAGDDAPATVSSGYLPRHTQVRSALDTGVGAAPAILPDLIPIRGNAGYADAADFSVGLREITSEAQGSTAKQRAFPWNQLGGRCRIWQTGPNT